MSDPTTIPGATEDCPAIAIARIGAITGRNDTVSDWVDVHFNPASLQLQVSNELKDTRNNERKQYVAKSNAKLTLELQFDTTDTGEDVTHTTRKLQAFIAPPLPAGDAARTQLPPPVVMFEWGRITFKGIAESYKETIDFFSGNGVPLRSSVNLTLSRQDQVFDDAPGGAPANAGTMDDALDTSSTSPAGVSNAAESPGAARSIAAANGQEDLRFGNGAALTVGASINLKPAIAFSAGGSIGAGIGLDLAAAIGGALGAGAGIGSGASAGGGPGLSALARLSATEGAFAGLRSVATPSAVRLNTAQLVPQVRSAGLSTDRNASFDVGGKATLEGPAGLRADVGAGGSLKGRLTFDTR